MKIEPSIRWPVRAPSARGTQAAAAPPQPPEQAAAVPLLPAPDWRGDVRNMSPRKLAELAHELYLEGSLGWDEYKMLGFPSELHPQYDATIGALTGEPAAPDKPRDILAEWEERLDFSRRHTAPESDLVKRTQRVVNVLRWQDQPKISLQA